jgi:putative spermidine/putrescine transport system substrate-binding protein
MLAFACVPSEAPEDAGPEESGETEETETATDGGAVTFVDTAGGANFQRFFSELLPQASEELGIDIDYVPSSAPEMQQRLAAQSEGGGDIGLILLKPDGIINMLEDDVDFLDLRDYADSIENLANVADEDLESAMGVPTDGKAAPFWRDQFGLVYNEEHIPDPPSTREEFYERRDEWEGRIGMIRPDADSGGGRLMLRDFLISEGVDMSLSLEEMQQTPEWEEGLEKFAEFSSAFHEPLASEPPLLFQQFAEGDIWITEYAIDYSLWSRDQGLLPDSVRAEFLEDGHYGDAAYLSIPANATEEQQEAAQQVINWLLSVEAQVQMITDMWVYMGIDNWDEVPDEVWEHIPHWDEVQENRIPLDNFEAFDWLREHGIEYSRG